MPYDRLGDLPDSVRDHMPKHAQAVYKEAFNSAWDQYRDPDDRRGDAGREETAHRVARGPVNATGARNSHRSSDASPRRCRTMSA